MILRHLASLSFIFCLKQNSISFVSAEDFFELTTQPHFVDKTDLLAYLFEKTANIPRTRTAWNYTTLNYYLVTRPRGFGKTTNLKMIQSFAQFELGLDNKSLPWNETEAYEIFSKLKISQKDRIVRYNLAQYAVMFLDLTFQAEDLVNEDAAVTAFGKKLADIFRPYEWFLKNVTQDGARVFLTNLLAGKADPTWIHRATFYVGKTLNRIGGKGTIFLVDNFDSAARLAVLKPGLKGVPFLYDLIHKTIYEFVQLMRSENAEHRRSLSLLTGISDMRFNNEHFSTSTVYRKSIFLQHGNLSAHFGFTQQEVETLMDKFNCSMNEKFDVAKYYNGYETDTREINLYNPISIIEYLKSKQSSGVAKLEPYWARNESLEFVLDFAKTSWFGQKLAELVAKNECSLRSSISEQDWRFLMSFFDGQEHRYENIDDSDAGPLLYYFYEHGFLRHKDGKSWCEFEFANNEVKSEITRRLKEIGVVAR